MFIKNMEMNRTSLTHRSGKSYYIDDFLQVHLIYCKPGTVKSSPQHVCKIWNNVCQSMAGVTDTCVLGQNYLGRDLG